MPPRTGLTGSFSLSDLNNEVVCPLKNQDGSNCRKRCLGEKRYRSMQEHIRRAHPEHYISKLPATEESFQLMINTPPSARPPPPPNGSFGNSAYGHDRDGGRASFGSPAPPRPLESVYPATTTSAAMTLAQLHSHGADSEWGSDADHKSGHDSLRPATNPSFDLPPLHSQFKQETLNPFHSPRPRELLPSIMSQSPPGRSTTLPPIQRPRPRKSSLGQNARKPKHERTKSKDHARRMSIEGRKAFSAEPQAAASVMARRWEDLIEAATSANEADLSDRDVTPVPRSPSSAKRASLPPFPSTISHFEAYKASPLQHVLTPPPPDDGPEPFPSVESMDSSQSGQNFHMPSSSLNNNSDSSPTLPQPAQIYCAHCRRLALLRESYACNECIGGFCADCAYLLGSDANRGRGCPKCKRLGVRYRPIQLDLR